MRKIFLTAILACILCKGLGQDFKIPVRTMAQKQARAVNLLYNNVLAGISHAKSSHVDLKVYCAAMGDLYKTSWNKENGYTGFVNGVLANWENLRREIDPPSEILEQSATRIVYHVKINYKDLFKDGPVYNVTAEEFNLWMQIVYSKIGEHLGATYAQEILPEDWIKITITKK